MLQYKYLSRKGSTRNLAPSSSPPTLSLFYPFHFVTLCVSQMPVNMNIPSQLALVSAIPRVIQTIRSTFTMTFEFGSGWEHNSCFPLFTEMFYFRVWQFLPGSRTRFLAGLESVPLRNAHMELPALLNAAWNLKRTTYFFSHTNECN